MTHADRQDRARWIASGLPEAVTTIMFRDGTLPPPHAARWYDSSLTTDEIVEFRRAGRSAPDVAFAESLHAHGLPTDQAFVAAWEGFGAEQILDAIDRGFTSGGQFAPWAATDADVTEVERLAGLGPIEGFEPVKVLAQLRAGRSPEEIAFALASGVKPKKAAAWIDQGMSAPVAEAWSTAGFSAASAAAWSEVIDDPEIARLLESIGLDVDEARERRPDGGWTTHAVRRQVAVTAGATGHGGPPVPLESDESSDLADRWASTTIPLRKLATWVASGVRPEDAAVWLDRRIRPAEAAVWASRGFAPDDARDWSSAGVDPDVAARRRDAGVRPPTTTS